MNICVCVSLSRQGQPRVPFSKSKISLQENILRLYGLVSFSIYDRGILKRSGSQYLESIISRFSLISVHFQRFGCTMPLSLNKFLFLRRFSYTIEWKRFWLSYCLLDNGCFVRNTKLNRPHLTIATTNSFRVRERRLIIFGQNMLGEVLFWTVESRVDDLRHLLFPLICRNVLIKNFHKHMCV